MNTTPSNPAATHAPADVMPSGLVPTLSWRDLASHRSYLVRFAQRRLRDPLLAEDAVHDVFEAVLAGRAVFSGRAALRSWLTAVLKHKIVDAHRRHPDTESLDNDAGEHAAMATASPQPGPEDIADQQQRLTIVLRRIEALPAGLRDAMRLRVLEEQSTEDVCRELGISEDNLFVRIHRARKQLLS